MHLGWGVLVGEKREDGNMVIFQKQICQTITIRKKNPQTFRITCIKERRIHISGFAEYCWGKYQLQ